VVLFSVSDMSATVHGTDFALSCSYIHVQLFSRCVCHEQMSSFDVERLRQVLEEETELLNRGSADEVTCNNYTFKK